MSTPVYGAVEAGGTKFVCAIGTGPDNLIAEATFPTTTPEETLGRTIAFFRQHLAGHSLRAIGIGSFGPLDLIPGSPTWGYITTTPKAGWGMVDIAGAVRAAFDLPVAIDTDVNGAAVGEHRWGAGQDRDPLIYITVGTGVGGGLLVHGQPVHGLQHPEMGHMYLPHDRSADPFDGACPYHGNCLEGMASGFAMGKRWGVRAETLGPDHPAWALEAQYLAYACASLTCTVSPQRIILGGGVMDQPGLLDAIRRETELLLNNYVRSPLLKSGLEDYIVRPGLGRRAGVLGALALAMGAV